MTNLVDSTSINQLLTVAASTARRKICEESRKKYNCSLRYTLAFMQENFPSFVEVVENDHGDTVTQLKLPLSFESVASLFAKLQIDEDIPRRGRKRKREASNLREELQASRRAAINRGDEDITDELDEEVVDNTINKDRTHTISLQCLRTYKSALKTHYEERGVEFACPERPRH
jgi:hypothetical protein